MRAAARASSRSTATASSSSRRRASVGDFYAPEEVERIYYPEVEKLLRDTLGASRVKIFDHTVRNAARAGAREPSRRVHNDHTLTSAPRRVRDHLGEEAPELLKRRFGIVNVWRPIRGPVQDSPLALCDARTFTDDDLIASDLVYRACARRDLVGRVQARPPLVLLLRHAARRGAADPGA